VALVRIRAVALVRIRAGSLGSAFALSREFDIARLRWFAFSRTFAVTRPPAITARRPFS